jgi:hypothetical protein
MNVNSSLSDSLSSCLCRVMCNPSSFKFKVLKFCHIIKLHFLNVFNFIKILACYIAFCLTLHVSACRPLSGVVAVGKLLHFLCTILLYLTFSVQSSAAHYVFLVSRVLALLHGTPKINEVQQFPDTNNT